MVIDADVSVCCGVSAGAAERSRLVEGRLAPAKEKHTQLCVPCVLCREGGPAAARDPGGGEQWSRSSCRGRGRAAKIVVVEGFIIQDPSSFSTACLDLPFRACEATGHKSGDEVGSR
jgi:hypothetical protein